MTSDIAQAGSDGNNVDSAAESDIVTQWVDHELRKIKRNLSKELMAKHSSASVQSPDLFDRSVPNSSQKQKNMASSGILNERQPQGHLYHDNTYQGHTYDSCEVQGQAYEDSEGNISSLVTPDVSETSLPSDRQETGDHAKYSPVQEFYFDDEMYMAETPAFTRQPQMNGFSEHQSKREVTPCREESPVKPKQASRTNLPMKTILKKTSSEDSSASVADVDKYDGKKQRLSKIPTSFRPGLSRSKLGDTPAYTSTVMVRSSVEDAGTHHVTHKMKNLKTGGSKTLLNDTVVAKKVTTKFKAAKL